MVIPVVGAEGWEIYNWDNLPEWPPTLSGPYNVEVIYYAYDERWPEHLHIEHDAPYDGNVSVTVPLAAMQAFLEELTRWKKRGEKS